MKSSIDELCALPHRGFKWDTVPGKIGAGIAESDFGTSPQIQQALAEAVQAQFFTYLPNTMAAELRCATADFYTARYGWKVSADQVHQIPDVVEGLKITLQYFVQKNAPVIVPTPAYMPFLKIPNQSEHPIWQSPMLQVNGRWQLDLNDIEQKLAQGAGLLILCNPHNPLGTVMRRSEMQELDQLLKRYKVRVFSDEIHAPIVYSSSEHVPYASISANAAKQTITATACSKGWNVPGLKAAQIILSNPEDEEVWQAREIAPTQLGSILGAVAAIAAYRDSNDWLVDTVRNLQSNRDVLLKTISDSQLPIRVVAPEATYLAWLDLRDFDFAAEKPSEYILREADIVVTDGSECGAVGIGFVRFNFALPPNLLIVALEKLQAALQKLY